MKKNRLCDGMFVGVSPEHFSSVTTDNRFGNFCFGKSSKSATASRAERQQAELAPGHLAE